VPQTHSGAWDGIPVQSINGKSGVLTTEDINTITIPSGDTTTGLAVTTQDSATGSQGVSITCATGAGTAHAHGITSNLTGSGNAFSSAANFVSANSAASCVQISGSETGRGSLKITHTGDGTSGDANASAISIDLQPAGTACQGIHIDSSAAGTTGALLDIRNAGNQLVKVKSDATFTIPSIVLGNGGPTITIGAGAPAVSAPVGSLYLRTDGGASTTLYVKESGTGTSGWVAK
jgi:hypothetical protein